MGKKIYIYSRFLRKELLYDMPYDILHTSPEKKETFWMKIINIDLTVE